MQYKIFNYLKLFSRKCKLNIKFNEIKDFVKNGFSKAREFNFFNLDYKVEYLIGVKSSDSSMENGKKMKGNQEVGSFWVQDEKDVKLYKLLNLSDRFE